MHVEIATAVIAPGWSALRRRRNLALVLLLLGVAVPLALLVYTLFTSRNRVALGLDSGYLGWVVMIGVLALATRLAALAEIWVAGGRRTSFDRFETVAVVGAVGIMVVGAIGVIEVGRARASIAPAFGPASKAVLFDADSPIETAPTVATGTQQPATAPGASTPATTVESSAVPVLSAPEAIIVTTTSSTTTTLPPKPSRPDSGVDATSLADVTTTLLLGGDAGPGRSGLRTDSMMLFSLHRPSGRASLISIPRNLRRMLFPPGSALEARYPYGFDDIANAVYPKVSANRTLREAYAIEGLRPGVVAIAQGIGYSLDVTIHDYVLVDMQGFLDLVDALGGVTIYVNTEIPMPGNVPGARSEYPDVIGPGVVQMDGTTALGYARSRYGDSDYHRARRQRNLLASLARQVSLTDVALSFGAVADAIGGTLRTSLTPDELAETLNVIGGETAIVESVGLVPPLVNVRRPDYDAMAKVVGAVQLALVTGESSRY